MLQLNPPLWLYKSPRSKNKNFDPNVFINSKFSKLLIVKFIEKTINHYWYLCKCDCGKSIQKSLEDLINKNSTSCGCDSLVKTRGKKFNIDEMKSINYGKLTVIEEVGKLGKKQVTYWKCNCECGNIITIEGYKLRSGYTTSCGCIKKSKKPKGEAGFNKLLNSYIKGASKRNLEFKLTKEEFRNLTNSNCYYCNKQPSQKSKPNKFHSEEGLIHSTYIYNGIDRVSSNLGYFSENCVSCCKHCNIAKTNLTLDEFRELIINIYKNFILKN